MCDADCRIYVDSNDVSIFLFRSFSEICGHGVGFPNIVNYAVSKRQA